MKLFYFAVSALSLELFCPDNFPDFSGEARSVLLVIIVSGIPSNKSRCRKTPRQRRQMCIVECFPDYVLQNGQRSETYGCRCRDNKCTVFVEYVDCKVEGAGQCRIPRAQSPVHSSCGSLSSTS